jgi:hypothetical protein
MKGFQTRSSQKPKGEVESMTEVFCIDQPERVIGNSGSITNPRRGSPQKSHAQLRGHKKWEGINEEAVERIHVVSNYILLFFTMV